MDLGFNSVILKKGIGITLIGTINIFSTCPAFGKPANYSSYWLNFNLEETKNFNGNASLIFEPKSRSTLYLISSEFDLPDNTDATPSNSIGAGTRNRESGKDKFRESESDGNFDNNNIIQNDWEPATGTNNSIPQDSLEPATEENTSEPEYAF